MLNQYLLAVNNLTISPENRLKHRVSELEQKQDEITELRNEYHKYIAKRLEFEDEAKREITRLNATLERMTNAYKDDIE